MITKKRGESMDSTPTKTAKISSEFLEIPWIVCKISSRPCNMKLLLTSDLTYSARKTKWNSYVMSSLLAKVKQLLQYPKNDLT
jgi:hypothetical protein